MKLFQHKLIRTHPKHWYRIFLILITEENLFMYKLKFRKIFISIFNG
jgi:hypothetical protein